MPTPPNSPINRDETASAPGNSDRLPGRVPEKIGHYHIKRIIASGGMGTVYEATQENPRRAVAVKVMKHGITSRGALRRFEYEAQILARLRHPGVAQIYEAGTHEDPGSPGGTVPFFAMEYIPNSRTLAQYADEKKLGTRQRLDLLVKVCDAVHHGHQKGIIHRDLKPSNILVDSNGQVKIIDFGVARSTDSDMAVTTLQTDVGQLIGTLQYMSPEQCDADPHDIDIRSDIYSLGVVLYELLSGKPPYDLKRVTMLEATRMIRDATPTRLSTMNKTLRGDVETIALKAMEKERTRRYQSAAEFGQDIERYLSGEAIMARRASIVYQLRIFARRNKTAFAAVAAVFIVLVGATVVSTTLYWRAESARKHAEESKAQAEAVTTFLTDTLTSADPAQAQGNEVTVKEVLDKAGEKVGISFAGKSLVEATIRNALGRTYLSLGDFPTGKAHLEAGFDRCKQESGAEVQAVSLLNALGVAEQRMGNFAAAEARLRESLRRASMIEGEASAAAVSGAMYHTGSILADQLKLGEAESMLTTAVEKARALPNQPHPNLGFALSGLGIVKKLKGEYAAAEKLLREAWAIRRQLYGDFHPGVAEVIRNLGGTLLSQGKHKVAQELFEQCLVIDRKLHPMGHPDLGGSLSQVAAAMVTQGQIKEAEPYLREAVELHRKFDPQHMFMAESLGNLGVCLSQQSKFVEAEQYLREAIPLWQKLQGEESDHVARCTDQLGTVLQELGKFEEAEKYFREAIAIRRKTSEGSFTLPITLNNLADLLSETGRFEEALPLAREAVDLRRSKFGDKDTNLGGFQITLGEVLLGGGDPAGAERTMREGIQRLSPQLSEEYFEVADARSLLGCSIARQGRFAEAEPILLKSLVTLEKTRTPTDRRIANAIHRITELYDSWDKAEPGKGYAEKAAEWRNKQGKS